MNIIGLDLSLTATGIAHVDGSTSTVKTRAEDGDRRLVRIQDAIRAAIAPGVQIAVIEDLPTHAKGAGITGMVHGAVRAVLIEHAVPYALVVAATLKAYATGNGHADKTAMALAAFKRAGVEFPDDNQCDAWWLRVAGLDRHGTPLFRMPVAHLDRLDKAKWPNLAVRS